MNTEEFLNKLREQANYYAHECVVSTTDIETLNIIKSDFIEGGIAAYCILNNTTWDD